MSNDDAISKRVNEIFDEMFGRTVPAATLTGHAITLRNQSIAQARLKHPADTAALSDDDVWDRLRTQTVSVELFTIALGSVTDVVVDLEQRITALEHPKQPWE